MAIGQKDTVDRNHFYLSARCAEGLWVRADSHVEVVQQMLLILPNRTDENLPPWNILPQLGIKMSRVRVLPVNTPGRNGWRVGLLNPAFQIAPKRDVGSVIHQAIRPHPDMISAGMVLIPALSGWLQPPIRFNPSATSRGEGPVCLTSHLQGQNQGDENQS